MNLSQRSSRLRQQLRVIRAIDLGLEREGVDSVSGLDELKLVGIDLDLVLDRRYLGGIRTPPWRDTYTSCCLIFTTVLLFAVQYLFCNL